MDLLHIPSAVHHPRDRHREEPRLYQALKKCLTDRKPLILPFLLLKYHNFKVILLTLGIN